MTLNHLEILSAVSHIVQASIKIVGSDELSVTGDPTNPSPGSTGLTE